MQSAHAQVAATASSCLAALLALPPEQRGYRPKQVHTTAYNEVRSAFVALGPDFAAGSPPPAGMLRPGKYSYPDCSYAQLVSYLERIIGLLSPAEDEG